MMHKMKIFLACVTLLLVFALRIPTLYASTTYVYTSSPGFGNFTALAETQNFESTDPRFQYPYNGTGKVKAFNYDVTNNINPTFMLVAQRSWLQNSGAPYGYQCIDYAAAWRGVGQSMGGVTGPGSDIWTRRYIHEWGISVNYITAWHLVDNATAYPYWSGSADGQGFTSYMSTVYATYPYYNGFRPYDGACDCPGDRPRVYSSNVPEVIPTCP